jgi:hypothetical protein
MAAVKLGGSALNATCLEINESMDKMHPISTVFLIKHFTALYFGKNQVEFSLALIQIFFLDKQTVGEMMHGV